MELRPPRPQSGFARKRLVLQPISCEIPLATAIPESECISPKLDASPYPTPQIRFACEYRNVERDEAKTPSHWDVTPSPGIVSTRKVSFSLCDEVSVIETAETASMESQERNPLEFDFGSSESSEPDDEVKRFGSASRNRMSMCAGF